MSEFFPVWLYGGKGREDGKSQALRRGGLHCDAQVTPGPGRPPSRGAAGETLGQDPEAHLGDFGETGVAPGGTHSGVTPSNTRIPPDIAACLQREAGGCRAAVGGRRTRASSAWSDPLPFCEGARVPAPSGGEVPHRKCWVPLGMATFANDWHHQWPAGQGTGQDGRLSGLRTRVRLGDPSLSLTWVWVWSSLAGGKGPGTP